MKYKLIIFDLDGTLMDSIGGISKSVNMMLDNHGYPTFPVEQYYQFVGNGLLNTVKDTLDTFELSQEEIDLLYQEMLGYYEKHYDYYLKPYEGARDLLNQIKGSVHMAINSNKNEDMVKCIVNKYLGDYHFESVLGVKEGQPLKPNPHTTLQLMKELELLPEEVLFVGDSEVDIMTAENAGVDCCFVTWGFRQQKLEEMRSYKPKFIVDHFVEIYDVLKGADQGEK